MNLNRVVVGGLAGGLVMNVIDAVTNGVLLGERWRQETEALNPGLLAKASGSAYASYAFQGLFSWGTILASSLGGLLAALAGGYVGARLYRERA